MLADGIAGQTGFGISIGHWLLWPGLILLTLAWGITATTLALRNGAMERPSRVAQLYGYTVCLVAVVTILFTVPNLIEDGFRLSDPLHAERGFEPSLSSFDAYKATWERNRGFGPREADAAPRPPPSDEELRRQYEALRADRVAANRFEARRGIVSEVLLLVLAIGLFVGHWRWLRRRAGDAEAAA